MATTALLEPCATSQTQENKPAASTGKNNRERFIKPAQAVRKNYDPRAGLVGRKGCLSPGLSRPVSTRSLQRFFPATDMAALETNLQQPGNKAGCWQQVAWIPELNSALKKLSVVPTLRLPLNLF